MLSYFAMLFAMDVHHTIPYVAMTDSFRGKPTDA